MYTWEGSVLQRLGSIQAWLGLERSHGSSLWLMSTYFGEMNDGLVLSHTQWELCWVCVGWSQFTGGVHWGVSVWTWVSTVRGD